MAKLEKTFGIKKYRD